MRFIELFAGIGGFRLGLERAGHQCVWANEIDSYAAKVYRRNWPNGTLHQGDIRSVDPAIIPAYDLLVGGFPCQPVSLAGRRQAQKDARWLWPAIVRIFRASRPRYLLLENVPGLLSAGMGDVLRDLADGGYDAEWDCIPAAAFGAPHLRYRVFIFAYTRSPGARMAKNRSRRQKRKPARSWQPTVLRQEDRKIGPKRPDSDRENVASSIAQLANVGNSDCVRRIKASWPKLQATVSSERSTSVANATGRQNFRREPRDLGKEATGGKGINSTVRVGRQICNTSIAGLQDGRIFTMGQSGSFAESQRSNWWAVEPDVGRVAHGIPSRVDRLRCLGNAVVPQVVEWFGKRFKEIEEEETWESTQPTRRSVKTAPKRKSSER